MKTIAKNRLKAIDKIFSDGVGFAGYTLENGFSGESVTRAHVRGQLFGRLHAKLGDHENGWYTVIVHSNRWYKFRHNRAS